MKNNIHAIIFKRIFFICVLFVSLLAFSGNSHVEATCYGDYECGNIGYQWFGCYAETVFGCKIIFTSYTCIPCTPGNMVYDGESDWFLGGGWHYEEHYGAYSCSQPFIGECQTGNVACGNCGIKYCNESTCTYGACTGEGECSPGATRSCGSGVCAGTQTCTSGCVWGDCTSKGTICSGGWINIGSSYSCSQCNGEQLCTTCQNTGYQRCYCDSSGGCGSDCEITTSDISLSNCDYVDGECGYTAPPTCSNDCSPSGATQCSGNSIQTCGNYDADSCLEWNSPVSCGTVSCTTAHTTGSCNKTCSGGACQNCTPVCTCTAGWYDCDGNTGNGCETTTPCNQTPAINSVSDSPDPVTVGNSVSFNVFWTDASDLTKIHICKTNSISAGTCLGGSWCDSASFIGSSPTACNYTAQAGDVGAAKSYYAFVCDDQNVCSGSLSGSFTVQSGGPPISAPQVTSGAATNITSNSATLNGTLTNLGYAPASCPSCLTIVWFEWGLTTSYGNTAGTTTMTGTGVFSANISGLSQGTTYYFRANARNGGSW